MNSRKKAVKQASRVEQIYVQAARLFIEHGYAATSMRDIAEAVGISKPGLYHFVDSKEDILFNLIIWAMDTLDQQVTLPSREIADPLDRLVSIVTKHLYNIGNHHFQNDNTLTLIVDEPAGLSQKRRLIVNQRKAAYFGFVRETLVELENEGRLHAVNPTSAAFALLGMIVLLARWYRASGEMSLDLIVTDLASIALRGVVRAEALTAAGYDRLHFEGQAPFPFQAD